MSIEDDILIERFLRNELTESEIELVIKRINSDADFKAKVDFERELLESLDEDDWHFIEDHNKEQVEEYRSILRTKELTELKQELKRVNKNYKPSNLSSSSINWKRILVSSAAVLAIMFSFYMFTNSNNTPQELYADYFNTTDLPSLVSRDDSQSDMAKAQYLFEAQKYDSALILFNEELEGNTESNASLLLYKGISEMQLDKFTDAELTFNTLINSDLLDASKGYWYKALLYLKRDDTRAAKIILEKITSKLLYNKKKAKTLLEKLD